MMLVGGIKWCVRFKQRKGGKRTVHKHVVPVPHGIVRVAAVKILVALGLGVDGRQVGRLQQGITPAPPVHAALRVAAPGAPNVVHLPLVSAIPKPWGEPVEGRGAIQAHGIVHRGHVLENPAGIPPWEATRGRRVGGRSWSRRAG